MLDKQTRKIIRQHLESGDLSGLFIEIGWDNPDSKQPQTVSCDDQEFLLFPIAEKQGVVIYQCNTIPDGKLRQKIEKQAKNLTYEHLIVFALPDNSKQVWQWVARKKGEVDKFREHTWQTGKSTEPLMQKFDRIAFSLDEENELTIAGATQRLQSAFDREKVTKKFYESFKKEHEKFLYFVEGLTKTADKEMYASLMLNRLMFVYFIQKRGFLDGDNDYLENRFDTVRKTQGRDKFHGFYRAFLLVLFHRGLATPANLRDKATKKLIGKIPYLNGGLFEPNAFEGKDSKIQIADEAFKSIFSFFEKYEWTLDTRLTENADGNQINPDVLGHIFEKYINQKEMGAYYTKEDITGYITQNTVIPWLFRRVKSSAEVVFASDGFVWKQLRDDPDKYIYKDVAYGTDLELPKSISAGIKNVPKRGFWSGEANEEFGLPTEIWRETVARRQRHSDIREKIISGEITKIEDLITYNLNISQFAQDVIQNAENPDLIHAFWGAIKSIKVLDPACGSGAFLFAALNVLHDLYDACLEKMEQFVDLDFESAPPPPHFLVDFRKVLEQIKAPRNRSYFIYKEIILYNLYGVDIMKEAVEICKLRLFLKLASELKPGENIEALPDIDFNIRAGNSLIGYTSPADMENAIEAEEGKLKLDDRATEIRGTAEKLDKAFAEFRKKQMEKDGRVTAKDKKNLRDGLQKFVNRLDRFLAQDYEIKIKVTENAENHKDFQNWRKRVQPFHWWAEFYDIIDSGGFDAIIGNPPYLEASKVDYSPKGFKTKGTIQGYFIEQSDKLLSRRGGMSMIVPLALVSSRRMKPVQNVIETGRSTWYSNFARRPAKLFDGASPKLTIFISIPSQQKGIFTTGYKMWMTRSRQILMPTLSYVAVPEFGRKDFWIPKFHNSLETGIFNKVINQSLSVGEIWDRTDVENDTDAEDSTDAQDPADAVYYRNTGVGYWYVFTNFSPKYLINGKPGVATTQEKEFTKKEYNPFIAVALLSSSTFWWWYTIRGDCWHLTKLDIDSFKTNPSIFNDEVLLELGNKYLSDITMNSYLHLSKHNRGTVETQLFKIKKSKPIIDKIDATLSRHYGFTAEELDFIQNYDIKFRVGASEVAED